MVCLPQIISEGVVAVLDELLPIGWSTVVGANAIAFSTADFRVVSSTIRPTHKVDPYRYGIPVPSLSNGCLCSSIIVWSDLCDRTDALVGLLTDDQNPAQQYQTHSYPQLHSYTSLLR